jgi:hypothetical protein
MTPDSFISSQRSLPSRERSPDLAALGVGSQQVDDLDARLEHLGGRREVLDRRRVAVDRPTLGDLDGRAVVDRLAEQVEDAPERHLTDRHGDGSAGVDDLHAARQTVGGVHGDRADAVVAEVLLHLADQARGSVLLAGLRDAGILARRPPAQLDVDGVVDLGQHVGEDGLDHHALDFLDATDVAVDRGGGLGLVGAEYVHYRAGCLSDAGFHRCSVLLNLRPATRRRRRLP